MDLESGESVTGRQSDATRYSSTLLRAILVLGILGLVIYWGLAYASMRHTVWLEINGVRVVHPTRSESGADVLAEIAFEPSYADSLRVPNDEDLLAGVPIEIMVARRLHLVHDGRIVQLYAHGEDLSSLLAASDIDLGPYDELWVNGALLSMHDPLPAVIRPSRAGVNEWISEIRRPMTLELRRAVPLYVHDAGVQMSFYTTARTIGDALFSRGISVYMADRVYPALCTELRPGLTVSIDRARPVSLEVDGTVRLLRTRLGVVGDILSEVHIALDEEDYVVPATDTALETDMHITVVRVYEEFYVEETPISYQTRWEPNTELEIDQRRTAHWGREGAWRQQVRVHYENGVEVHRSEEEAWIAREPEDRIIEYGTQIVIRQVQTENGPADYWRKLRMLATSYNAPTAGKPPSHPTYGITRLGERARFGVIAVDPNVISLRQPMYVPGYGTGFAGDTGGAIKGRRVDLCYDDHNLVLWYRWVDVYLLTPVPPRSRIAWIVPNEPRERE